MKSLLTILFIYISGFLYSNNNSNKFIFEVKNKLNFQVKLYNKCLKNDLSNTLYFNRLFIKKGREFVFFNHEELKKQILSGNFYCIIFTQSGEIVTDNLYYIDSKNGNLTHYQIEYGKLIKKTQNNYTFSLMKLKTLREDKFCCNNLPRSFEGSYMLYSKQNKLQVKLMTDNNIKSFLLDI